MRRFDVLTVAMSSYTVESKRIASRKLFKRVLGPQDVKNASKRTKMFGVDAGIFFLINPFEACLLGNFMCKRHDGVDSLI